MFCSLMPVILTLVHMCRFSPSRAGLRSTGEQWWRYMWCEQSWVHTNYCGVYLFASKDLWENLNSIPLGICIRAEKCHWAHWVLLWTLTCSRNEKWKTTQKPDGGGDQVVWFIGSFLQTLPCITKTGAVVSQVLFWAMSDIVWLY